MGKKKDCFGVEDYVCMTPNCPYVKECIQAVWEKRFDRVMAKRIKPTRRRSPARISVES